MTTTLESAFFAAVYDGDSARLHTFSPEKLGHHVAGMGGTPEQRAIFAGTLSAALDYKGDQNWAMLRALTEQIEAQEASI